jgi:hypothetical protein
VVGPPRRPYIQNGAHVAWGTTITGQEPSLYHITTGSMYLSVIKYPWQWVCFLERPHDCCQVIGTQVCLPRCSGMCYRCTLESNPHKCQSPAVSLGIILVTVVILSPTDIVIRPDNVFVMPSNSITRNTSRRLPSARCGNTRRGRMSTNFARRAEHLKPAGHHTPQHCHTDANQR